MSEEFRDKKGRTVKELDIIKIFHFKGARWGKYYYMYKVVKDSKAIDVQELAHKGEESAHYCWLKNIPWDRTEIVSSIACDD